jgi:hypothetical protein
MLNQKCNYSVFKDLYSIVNANAIIITKINVAIKTFHEVEWSRYPVPLPKNWIRNNRKASNGSC